MRFLRYLFISPAELGDYIIKQFPCLTQIVSEPQTPLPLIRVFFVFADDRRILFSEPEFSQVLSGIGNCLVFHEICPAGRIWEIYIAHSGRSCFS